MKAKFNRYKLSPEVYLAHESNGIFFTYFFSMFLIRIGRPFGHSLYKTGLPFEAAATRPRAWRHLNAIAGLIHSFLIFSIFFSMLYLNVVHGL